jgi:hypothetical protein
MNSQHKLASRILEDKLYGKWRFNIARLPAKTNLQSINLSYKVSNANALTAPSDLYYPTHWQHKAPTSFSISLQITIHYKKVSIVIPQSV